MDKYRQYLSIYLYPLAPTVVKRDNINKISFYRLLTSAGANKNVIQNVIRLKTFTKIHKTTTKQAEKLKSRSSKR